MMIESLMGVKAININGIDSAKEVMKQLFMGFRAYYGFRKGSTNIDRISFLFLFRPNLRLQA